MGFMPLLAIPSICPFDRRRGFSITHIDHGVTAWNDGKVDIAPEYLYEHGKDVERTAE